VNEELFSVDAVTKVHVSRLDGAFGVSIGSTYVVLVDSEAKDLAEHILDVFAAVDIPTEDVVESDTEGESDTAD